jgi:hypothetical protein
MAVLKHLRIDEVSAVLKGANPHAKILIRKSATPYRRALSFNEVMTLHKADDDALRTEQPGDKNNPRVEDDVGKLTAKLKEFAALMIKVDPSKSEEEHLFDLMHSRTGRGLANHLNSLTKKESTMDVTKLHNIESVREVCKHIVSAGAEGGYDVVVGHARIDKRSDETDASAFSRIYQAPENIELRRACYVKGYPNMMSIEPASQEVGDTNVTDDSSKAYDALMEMAEKQHRLSPTLTIAQLFARVFADPANSKLAAAAHRRPNSSSTSGSENCSDDDFKFVATYTGVAGLAVWLRQGRTGLRPCLGKRGKAASAAFH